MEESLQQWLQREREAFPGECSLYCVDLTSGLPLAAIDEERQVVSASTVKLPVLLCALQEVMENRLDLQQFVELESEDRCEDTEVFVEEYRPGGASLWELLYWMMVSSDNTATNGVLRLLGFEKINAYCREIGLRSTCLQRKMLDFSAVERGFNNYTSAWDQFKCYDLLIKGSILTSELRAVAMDFLGRCRHMDGLQRFLCDDVKVLHKSGGLDHLSHDAGVIWRKDRPYFLGVFTWDGPSLDGQPEQSRFIGKLSRIVYDYMTKEEHP